MKYKLTKKPLKGGEDNMRTNMDEATKHPIRFMFCMLLFAATYFFVVDVFPVLAIDAPAGGTFAYDVYDIAVNSILKGPIGFVCGVAAIALGAISAIKADIMTAVPAVLGGAAVLKADAIVESLGAIF